MRLSKRQVLGALKRSGYDRVTFTSGENGIPVVVSEGFGVIDWGSDRPNRMTIFYGSLPGREMSDEARVRLLQKCREDLLSQLGRKVVSVSVCTGPPCQIRGIHICIIF